MLIFLPPLIVKLLYISYHFFHFYVFFDMGNAP